MLNRISILNNHKQNLRNKLSALGSKKFLNLNLGLSKSILSNNSRPFCDYLEEAEEKEFKRLPYGLIENTRKKVNNLIAPEDKKKAKQIMHVDLKMYIKNFIEESNKGEFLIDKFDKKIYSKYNHFSEEELKTMDLSAEFIKLLEKHFEEQEQRVMKIMFNKLKGKKGNVLKDLMGYIEQKEKDLSEKIPEETSDFREEELDESEKEILEQMKNLKLGLSKKFIESAKGEEKQAENVNTNTNTNASVIITINPDTNVSDMPRKDEPGRHKPAFHTNVFHKIYLKKQVNYEMSFQEKSDVSEHPPERLIPKAQEDNVKKSSLWINVDTYSNKKDLKFDHEEFKKIHLDQNVSPPELSMNLINVVQHPGIYPLQSIEKMNKGSTIKLLQQLPTPDMIEFESLDTYMRPHEDPNLKRLMKVHKLKYSSSTSGIGESLSHFFYKLTNFKSPHFYGLSESYIDEPLKFMMFQRKPASVLIHKTDKNSYSINKNNIFDTKEDIILLKMGKYMEKIFTTSPEDFEKRYMKSSAKEKQIVLKEEDYFKFVAYDNILLRSQIDCGGKDKDGNDIVFEIKTRAVSPIRYDVFNYFEYLDYDLNSLYGRHSSYEREFYDLIRGAFLKYLFQLKIGGMNGALVSYHNTQRIYGFEYISLLDMERRILGNSGFSDVIFKASLKLLQETLDYILKDFPDEDRLFVGFFANEWKGTLDVFVELVNEDSYKDYSESGAKEIIDYYQITGYRPKVHKYTVIATPILNNVTTTFSPIMYENNDSFNVKYQIIYSGIPSFNDYMQFTHEAFAKKDNFNIQSQYSGSWTLSYEK